MTQALDQAREAHREANEMCLLFLKDSYKVIMSRSQAHLVAAQRIVRIAVQAAERAAQPGANLAREAEIIQFVRTAVKHHVGYSGGIAQFQRTYSDGSIHYQQSMVGRPQDQQIVVQRLNECGRLEASVDDAHLRVWNLRNPFARERPEMRSCLFPTPQAPIPVQTILSQETYDLDPLLKAQDYLSEARSLGPVPQLVNEAKGISYQAAMTAGRIARFAEQTRERASQPNADIQRERQIGEIIRETITLYKAYMERSGAIIRNSQHANRNRNLIAMGDNVTAFAAAETRVRAAIRAINQLRPPAPTTTTAPASTAAQPPPTPSSTSASASTSASTSTPAPASTATQPPPTSSSTSASASTSAPTSIPSSASTATQPSPSSTPPLPPTVCQKMWTQLYAFGDDPWYTTVGKILLWMISIGTAGLVPGAIWCGWTYLDN